METENHNQPRFHYLVIGAGRQGTASAYDLCKFGEAQSLILADQNIALAQHAAERVNRLLGKDIVQSEHVDAANASAVNSLMKGQTAVLSAIPYYYNLALTELAIENHCHYCDMGGNTDVVQQQLALNEKASQAGVSVIPDCGMGPGLINNMGAYALTLLDEVSEIIIYDAGLPQKMEPPWYYQSTFNLNGLTNEMDGKSVVLRNGEIAYIDTLSEPELVHIPNIGVFEADLIAGGASTAPWSFKGKVKHYENKTMRHPKHWEWMRAYKALGLFSEQPIQLKEGMVTPREVFHTLLAKNINADHIQDMAIIQVKVVGMKNDIITTLFILLIDYYDKASGFTAMERLTGWHCAITMGFQATGVILPGAKPIEIAIAPKMIMDAFTKRGIEHKVF